MNFWKKKIKTETDEEKIANKLNVDADKIKALKKGNIHIKGDTLEKVLDAVATTEVEKQMENVKILKWYLDTDLKLKRREFGFNSQLEICRLLNEQPTEMNRLENKKFNKVNRLMAKMYYFYSNELNKKIEKEVEEINRKNKIVKVASDKYGENFSTMTMDSKKKEKVYKWFIKNDFRKLRLKNFPEYNQLEFAKLVGLPQSSYGTYETSKPTSNKVTKSMVMLYDFYHKNSVIDIAEQKKEEAKSKDEEIYKWYRSIENLQDYRRDFGYSLNKFMSKLNLSYDQARAFERHQYKSATNVVSKIYEFYQDEKNRLPKIEWEPNENNTSSEENSHKLDLEIEAYERKIEHLTNIIKQQNETLSRYEKIIDKLIQL